MLFKDTDISKRLDKSVQEIVRMSEDPNITEEQLERLLKIMEKIVKIAEECVEPKEK